MPSPPRRPRSPTPLVAAGVLSAAAQMPLPGPDVTYREPADADVPTLAPPWRFYIVRAASPGGGPTDEARFVRVGRQRYYILGRDSSVAHVLLTHPSVSKQHAVVQFRTARWTRGEGLPGAEEPSADFGGDRDLVEEGAVVPWLIDLSSRNGTYLNRVRIPPETFVRIRTGDTVVFGASTDECVFAQETQIEEEEEEE